MTVAGTVLPRSATNKRKQTLYKLQINTWMTHACTRAHTHTTHTSSLPNLSTVAKGGFRRILIGIHLMVTTSFVITATLSHLETVNH